MSDTGIYSKGKQLLADSKPETLKKEELERETLIKKASETLEAFAKLEPDFQALAKQIEERKAMLQEFQAFLRVLNTENANLDHLEADVLSQLRKYFEKMGIKPDQGV